MAYSYPATHSVDEVWSSKESKSLKISAVYAVCVIPIICAVVISAWAVRKFHYNRPKEKMREQNCCQKLMDCSISCYGSNVNPVTNSTVPLTELEAVSDDNKESENHSRSRKNEESRCQNLDDSLMGCHGITFNPEYTSVIFINNTVKLGDSEDTFDVDINITENKINSSSNGEDENMIATVEINPQSIYVDPCDIIKRDYERKTDLDISNTV